MAPVYLCSLSRGHRRSDHIFIIYCIYNIYILFIIISMLLLTSIIFYHLKGQRLGVCLSLSYQLHDCTGFRYCIEMRLNANIALAHWAYWSSSIKTLTPRDSSDSCLRRCHHRKQNCNLRYILLLSSSFGNVYCLTEATNPSLHPCFMSIFGQEVSKLHKVVSTIFYNRSTLTLVWHFDWMHCSCLCSDCA